MLEKRLLQALRGMQEVMAAISEQGQMIRPVTLASETRPALLVSDSACCTNCASLVCVSIY